MAKRAGGADLPLHSGRVPQWLADRMTRLGTVMSEAIVHHYGRDELLRRLANPFWFQSFGAVMGMDWHSSGITTSVIGALKRGLVSLEDELGIHVCGGRGKYSRQTPHELRAIGERIGFNGEAFATTSRLVAKVDSAAVQDGFELYLHAFIVSDEGCWTVVQQGMNDRRRQARRYHWLSEGLKSFVDEPHTAIEGQGQGEIVNLTDHRAEASRLGQVGLLLALGPDGIVRKLETLNGAKDQETKQSVLPNLLAPQHHDVRPQGVWLRRLHGNLAAAADRGPADFSELLLTPGVGARTACTRACRRGRPWRALSLHRSSAVFLRPWRQGRPSVSGAASCLRRDDPRPEICGAKGEARTRGRACGAQAPGRPGKEVGALCFRTLVERLIADEDARSPSYDGRTVFDNRRKASTSISIMTKRVLPPKTPSGSLPFVHKPERTMDWNVAMP